MTRGAPAPPPPPPTPRNVASCLSPSVSSARESFANAELFWSHKLDREGRRFGVAARAMSRRPKTLCLKRSPQAIAAPAHGYAGTFASRRAPFEHVAPPRARARAPEALSPLVLSYARATERA